MSTTTTNMGLKRWNLGVDGFSYSELSDNWTAVDQHDHSSGKGVQIPTGGIANGAVTLAKLATNSVDATKVLDGSITDTELASPNNGVWRPLYRASGRVGAGTSGTIYPAIVGGWTTSLSSAVDLFSWATTTVSGKTTRWRTRITVATNATTPTGVTLTPAASPITASAGGSGALTLTAGGATATGSALSSIGSSSIVTATGSQVTAPAAGLYVLNVTVGGTLPANSMTHVESIVEWCHT